MSALAHYLEEAGIATVAISLVRPQSERTRPPRALWVPFELGRPFGPPSDAKFQTRVVLHALSMLESPNGPVTIEDFPEDDPRAEPDLSWQAPANHSVTASASIRDLANALKTEIRQLTERYRLVVARRQGRTTVGLSGLTIEAAGDYVARFLSGEVTDSPSPDLSPPLALRYAVDDLKAYYTEAASAGAGEPSSRQLGDWFWNGTTAGAAIHVLRQSHLMSEDERLKFIATLFIVPGARVPPAG
ncbi:MAG: hypothetical protein HYR63_29495 [Proteobacteria bacterium]|nr:hypothetical protein [Pseudomonadota bacterium]